MENINYEIDIDSVPVGDRKVLTVLNRPKYTYISLLIVSLLFIIFASGYVKLFGVVIIAFTLYSYLNKKDKVLLEVYTNYVVVYDNVSQPNKCIYFTWEDIEEWLIGPKNNMMDTFIIHLKNMEDPITIHSFSNFGLNYHFQKRALGKQNEESKKKNFIDSIK